MPILTGRRVRPHLVRVLNRQLDDPNVSADDKEAIQEALLDDAVMTAVSQKVAAKARGDGVPLPPFPPLPPIPGNHPFLSWLLQNLPTIIAWIMALLNGG